jgi:cell division transport system ATP-binding protein
MIQFSHVYKTFRGEIHALRDVNFKINKGEFVFLTGHSGAGKTTLFNLLAGFDRPSSGKITVANYDIHGLRDEETPLFRRKVGVVFQDFKLLNNRTVRENILLPLEIINASHSMMWEKKNQMLGALGLLEKENCYPDQLSGGEKQRLAIGRALISQPEVIIADEPTGNLDPQLSRDVMKVFEQCNKLGTTVFIASHDQQLVQEQKRRVINLKKGEVHNDATAA